MRTIRDIEHEYDHILRMWPRFMAGNPITFLEYLHEPVKEQKFYYRWMLNQAGEYADLM